MRPALGELQAGAQTLVACGEEEEKRQLKELSEEVYKQFMSIWLEEGPDEVFERAAAEYNRLVVLQE